MKDYAWLDRMAHDLRYSVRALKNNPGFAALAIFTAALGIGANTAIFSVVDAVLLRPPPYPDAGRLVAAANVAKDAFFGWGVGDFQYAAWREQAGIFEGIAAYQGLALTLTGAGEPERLRAETICHWDSFPDRDGGGYRVKGGNGPAIAVGTGDRNLLPQALIYCALNVNSVFSLALAPPA